MAWGVAAGSCAGAWASAAECEELAAVSPASTADLLPDGANAKARETLTFPDSTLFAPLVADPKEPHFYASVLHTRPQGADTSVTLASVGFGEEFGVWGERDRRGGWQVGLQAGVLAQLNLDPATSYALINADYIGGVVVAWRQDPIAVRVRVYHQSSHLGDEYLLENPGVERINVSFEELEAVAAYDVDGGRGRVYAGGGLLLHRYPAMDRRRLQCGFEWRPRNVRVISAPRERLETTPVMAAELKVAGELHWRPSVRAVAGLELARERGQRGVTLLAEYYYGYFPYGQFFDRKVQSFGFGVHLSL